MNGKIDSSQCIDWAFHPVQLVYINELSRNVYGLLHFPDAGTAILNIIRQHHGGLYSSPGEPDYWTSVVIQFLLFPVDRNTAVKMLLISRWLHVIVDILSRHDS